MLSRPIFLRATRNARADPSRDVADPLISLAPQPAERLAPHAEEPRPLPMVTAPVCETGGTLRNDAARREPSPSDLPGATTESTNFKTTQGYIDLAGETFREEAALADERMFGAIGQKSGQE